MAIDGACRTSARWDMRALGNRWGMRGFGKVSCLPLALPRSAPTPQGRWRHVQGEHGRLRAPGHLGRGRLPEGRRHQGRGGRRSKHNWVETTHRNIEHRRRKYPTRTHTHTHALPPTPPQEKDNIKKGKYTKAQKEARRRQREPHAERTSGAHHEYRRTHEPSRTRPQPGPSGHPPKGSSNHNEDPAHRLGWRSGAPPAHL